MRNKLLSCVFLSALLCVSCTNSDQQNKEAAYPRKDTVIQLRNDTIRSTITNTKGETLHLLFDTLAHTALLIFKTDSISLKQDTIASGIKYSNSMYVYTEWHGTVILKKTGKVIFSRVN